MAISRDGGSAFPIKVTANGTVGNVTSGTFSVTNSPALIVVTVARENFTGTNQTPFSIAWTGGTPANASVFTKQKEALAATNNGVAQVWTATTTGSLSSVSVDITATSSTQASLAVTIDALLGAQTTIGVFNTAVNTSSAPNNITLTGVTAGSYLYVANYDEGAALSPVGSTNEQQETVDVSTSRSAVGDNTSGTSGNINVGWTGNTAFNGLAAVEILAVASVSQSQTDTTGDSDPQQASKFTGPYTLFQPNAFQQNAFAILGGTTGTSGPSGGELDTLGDSETQVSKQTQVSVEADTLGFSDPQVAKQGQAAVESDTLGFSESQSAAQKQAGVEIDTLGFSDPQVSLQTQVSVESDTLGFSDPQVSKQTQVSAESDTLGFSESQVASQGQAAVQTDTLGFSESQAATLGSASGLTAGEVDTLGFSETQESKQSQQSVQIDVLGLTDQQISLQLQIAAHKDTLGFGDSCAATIALGPSGGQQDTLGFGESQAASIGGVAATGSEQDILGFGDSCEAQVWFAQQVNFFIWDGSKWVGGQFP
jgi:hypothetical protein